MGPGKVLCPESPQEGQFSGKHSSGNDLRKLPGMGPGRVASAFDTEQPQAFLLRINRCSTSNRPDRERGESDRDIDSVVCRINRCHGETSLDHMGRVLTAGDEYR